LLVSSRGTDITLMIQISSSFFHSSQSFFSLARPHTISRHGSVFSVSPSPPQPVVRRIIHVPFPCLPSRRQKSSVPEDSFPSIIMMPARCSFESTKGVCGQKKEEVVVVYEELEASKRYPQPAESTSDIIALSVFVICHSGFAASKCWFKR
jgi:hypothetical protein